MKRILLIVAFIAISFGAKAQAPDGLPDGSIAPNFTAVDINGVSHTLQSYLDAGKTVIIDISATWCAPCWNYHHTNALEDLYYAYGPDSSNEVVVLFIEGDWSTNMDDIKGLTQASQGDWTIGSPYPIIDDSGEIAVLYDVASFPTIYMICPDGVLQNIGQPSVEDLKSGINAGCLTTPLVGTQNNVRTIASDFRSCESSGSVQAVVKNIGVNTITSASVVLKENGVALQTYNYSGNLTQFLTKTVNFDDYEFDASADYSVEVVNVNSTTPTDTEISKSDVKIGVAAEVGTEIQVHIYTDNYPGQIKYRIRNSANEVVHVGGFYQAGPGANGAGGPDANTEIIETITLPNATDCYRIQMLDSQGDGWLDGPTEHGLEVFSNGVSAFRVGGAFPTTPYDIYAAFKTTESLGTKDNLRSQFQIYPNPSNGIFNIRAKSALTIVVSDMTGKVVYKGANITDGTVVNLSTLQTGMYIAKMNDGTSESVEKLLIK